MNITLLLYDLNHSIRSVRAEKKITRKLQLISDAGNLVADYIADQHITQEKLDLSIHEKLDILQSELSEIAYKISNSKNNVLILETRARLEYTYKLITFDEKRSIYKELKKQNSGFNKIWKLLHSGKSSQILPQNHHTQDNDDKSHAATQKIKGTSVNKFLGFFNCSNSSPIRPQNHPSKDSYNNENSVTQKIK